MKKKYESITDESWFDEDLEHKNRSIRDAIPLDLVNETNIRRIEGHSPNYDEKKQQYANRLIKLGSKILPNKQFNALVSEIVSIDVLDGVGNNGASNLKHAKRAIKIFVEKHHELFQQDSNIDTFIDSLPPYKKVGAPKKTLCHKGHLREGRNVLKTGHCRICRNSTVRRWKKKRDKFKKNL